MAVAISDLCEVRLCAVMSPEDREEMSPVCADTDAAFCTHQNFPVSMKWQTGVRFALQRFPKAKGLMTVGSDDFLSEAYLRRSIELLLSGHSLGWGPDDCYMFDSETGRLGYWSGNMRLPSGLRIPCGAGRVYTGQLLSRVGRCLWRQARDRGLDTAASIRLEHLGYPLDVVRMNAAAGEIVVDVKAVGNIHPWSEFKFTEVLDPKASAKLLRRAGLDNVLALGPAGRAA